jgi:hypothetical protein
MSFSSAEDSFKIHDDITKSVSVSQAANRFFFFFSTALDSVILSLKPKPE